MVWLKDISKSEQLFMEKLPSCGQGFSVCLEQDS